MTESEYDARGLLTATIDEAGNRTENEYDELGQLVLTRDASLVETHFAYDATGNRVSVTDAPGRVTTYGYDLLGRGTAVTFDDGSSTATEYDAEGLVTRQIDANDNATWFAYDEAGRLTGVIDALGGTTAYAYDELGSRISQTDANDHTTTWAYDDLGRVVRHTLPLGMSRSYVYDAAGNRTHESDFEGNLTERDFDLLGRVVERRVPGEAPVSFTYTADGLREMVTDGQGTTSFEYDARRRLTRVDHPDGTWIAYTYDPAGNVASVETPGGTTTYTYDALQRLESVIDADGGETLFTYDAVGSPESVDYPNGTATLFGYDARHRLTQVEHLAPDLTVFAGYQYTLDPVGNRLSVLAHDGRLTGYTYDALQRLTREEATGGLLPDRTIEHAYDLVGNRTLETVDGVPTAATYDANDRILTQGDVSFGYDADGNTISKNDPGAGITVYAYDELNRLTGVSAPGLEAAYAYDADGNRVEATDNGLTTHFLVDANRDYAQVIEERDDLGGLQAHFTWGAKLVRQERGASVSYYHADAHASIRQLTNAAGNVTDTFDYDAYGELLNRTGGTVNHHRYAGEQWVPGLEGYYLRARYYTPGAGRFLTRDESGGFPRTPLSLNKYLYANGNPVMGIDPSGRFSVIQATVATTVASILVNTAITGYSIGRTIYAAASGGSLVPDGVLISFRGVSYGAQARVVGLGFAGGFDAVYSSTRNRLVIFLASDFSVSPFATFKTEKGLKLKGSWSIGPIWNLGEPKNFRGFGASANWPLGSLHLLCRMGVIRSGSVWGYACQSRKLSLNKRGYTVAFGFSGFSDSTTSFIKISDGTEVSSDLLGWAIPVDASPLVEFLKPIVESIASSPTLDTVLEKIGSLSSGG